MDQEFKDMLLEAEVIRSQCRLAGNDGRHAKLMARMINYASWNNLFSGNVFAGNASDESLSHATEQAAYILEVFNGEEVGSVLNLAPERKIEINWRALAKIPNRT